MSAAQTRWRILMACLTLTVIAIFVPAEPADDEVSTVTTAIDTQAVRHQALVSQSSQDSAPDQTEDPFAPRSWTYGAEPITPSAALSSVATVKVAETVDSTPPLPYKFLGKFNDGTELVVYLGRGEQSLVAKNGETLEGIYKIVEITEKNIEFVYLPREEKQTLVIE